MKRFLLFIVTIILSFSAFAQNELISGWRLHSIGTSKNSKTEVNYEAAAALILQQSSTILLQILNQNGDNLGPVIELTSYSIDPDYTTPNAFAITGNAVLRDNSNLRGNVSIH